MKDNICFQWETTDMGDSTKIIGIEITHKDDFTISQQKYIKSILQCEHMENANPVATPLDPNIKIQHNPDGNEGNQSNSFAKLLRELQFLANVTRPNIAYTMNQLAVYTAHPSLQHTGALKQILWYLAGTKSYGVTYSRSPSNTAQSFLWLCRCCIWICLHGIRGSDYVAIQETNYGHTLLHGS